MPKRYITRTVCTDNLETYLNDMSRKGYNVISVAPAKVADVRETLFLFREFISYNVTQWKLGAGAPGHPMWARVAEALGDQNTRERSTPEWKFIQGENHNGDAVLPKGGADTYLVTLENLYG